MYRDTWAAVRTGTEDTRAPLNRYLILEQMGWVECERFNGAMMFSSQTS